MFKKSLAYFKIRFNEEIQYRTAAIAGILTQICYGAMYIMLYTTFMDSSPGSTGMTVSQISTYVWLQQAFLLMMNTWRLDPTIYDEIKTGNVAMNLVKPINLYDVWYSKVFGRKSAMTLIRAVPLLIIAMLPFLGEYRLIIQTNPILLILSILSFLLTCFLVMAYTMIMLAVILYTVDDSGVRSVFSMVLEFMTGSYIPLAFMPQGFIAVSKFLPFYYMQNMTFNIYSGYLSDYKEIVFGLVLQVFWLIVLTIIGRLIVKKRLSKISVQGG